MTKLARIASLLAFLFAACVSYSPAHAQSFGGFGGGGGGGGDDAMMDKMAPMLNVMKKKLGKKRFTTLMQTMGPMFDKMGGGGEGGGFGGGGFGGYGGGFGGMGGFDMGSLGGIGGMGGMDQLMSSDMIGTVMTLAMSSGGIGHHRKGRRSHKRH